MASSDDEKTEVDVVEYMRGPVKLMERAQSKAQNDYASEPYPASACVIDFNRCALIFDDISSLLHGLQLFVNKVKQRQSGNIIAIARDKNGFIEYVKEAQYADIKLNVVIKGQHNSIIGEVQFLLRVMKEFKATAHNLYAIQRREEAIKTSVKATLPILLDQQKEIFSIACIGNVKKMCNLMITQNLGVSDLLFTDKVSTHTIFNRICKLGHYKILLFLESMMDQNEFIDHLFMPNNYFNHKPIEQAVKSSNALVSKHLFAKEAIKDRFRDNDPMIHRLLIFLFAHGMDHQLGLDVLSALDITKEKVVQMINYKCPAEVGDKRYYKMNILTAIAWVGTIDHLRRFIDFIGQQVFIDNMFKVDQYNRDVMRWAIFTKKLNVIEYILSIKVVAQKYLTDDDALHYLCASFNESVGNKEAVQCVVDKLGLTTAKLEELNKVRKTEIEKILPFTK